MSPDLTKIEILATSLVESEQRWLNWPVTPLFKYPFAYELEGLHAYAQFKAELSLRFERLSRLAGSTALNSDAELCAALQERPLYWIPNMRMLRIFCFMWDHAPLPWRYFEFGPTAPAHNILHLDLSDIRHLLILLRLKPLNAIADLLPDEVGIGRFASTPERKALVRDHCLLEDELARLDYREALGITRTRLDQFLQQES